MLCIRLGRGGVGFSLFEGITSDDILKRKKIMILVLGKVILVLYENGGFMF